MTRLFEIAKTTYADLLKQLHEAGIDAVSEKNWSRLQSTAQLIDKPEFATAKVHEQIAGLKKQLLHESIGIFFGIGASQNFTLDTFGQWCLSKVAAKANGFF